MAILDPILMSLLMKIILLRVHSSLRISSPRPLMCDDGPNQRSRQNTLNDETEAERYVKLAIVARSANPLSWWKEHEKDLLHLASSTRKYLAIPASSVTSERNFKVAKFAGKYRFRLKAKNLERMLFLHYNLEALGNPLLHELPKPPADVNLPNEPLKLASNDTAPQQDIDGSSADA